MDDVSPKPLRFKAGVPTIIEASCKRNLPADKAPPGRVRTEVSADLALSDNLDVLDARITVTASGIAGDDAGTAFEATCIAECSFKFDGPRQPEELEREGFTRIFCDPLYQRAATFLQDLVWRMGYNAARLPLMFPQSANNAADTPTAAPAKPKPRKRAAPRKKAAPPAN